MRAGRMWPVVGQREGAKRGKVIERNVGAKTAVNQSAVPKACADTTKADRSDGQDRRGESSERRTEKESGGGLSRQTPSE